MPFIPRTRKDIRDALIASFVARGVLVDVGPGSNFVHDLDAVAGEIEFLEHRAWRIRRAFAFQDAEGEDLDERMSDLPPPSLRRKPASAARGQSLRIQRNEALGTPLVIEPGNATFARDDDPDVVYVLGEQATIAAGEEYYPVPGSSDLPLLAIAVATGERTDAPQGTITRVVSGPPELIGVTNVEPVTGGRGTETDNEFVRRGMGYLASLAKTQPRALIHLARSLASDTAQLIRHAAIFEDPHRPAYSELIIDDGTGLGGLRQPGQVTSGTIPESGISSLYFQAPAVSGANMVLKRNGVAVSTPGVGVVPPYLVIEERGMLYPELGLFDPGDTWEISGYEVYTGVIAELQVALEGAISDPFERSGWRANATRCRVRPPLIEWLTIDMILRVSPGVTDLVALRARAVDEAVAYLQGLGPGEVLYLDLLTCVLTKIPGIMGVNYNSPLSREIHPATTSHVLRTSTTLAKAM